MPYTKTKPQRRRTTAGKGTTKFLKEYVMDYKRKPSKSSKPREPYDRMSKEIKFHDILTYVVSPTTGGIFRDSLNIIAQGTDENTRIGRKVFIKDIFARVDLTLPFNQTSSFSTDTARIIIYLDKQTNGAVPTTLQILTTANVFSYYNMSDIQRFKIYYDKFFVFNATMDGEAASRSVANTKLIKIALTDLNIPIEYDASVSTGALTSIRSNNFGILSIGLHGDILASWTIRTRYTD